MNVFINSVRVMDSDGRVRTTTSYGSSNGASLTYIRPCTNYTVWVKVRGLGPWSAESEPFHFRSDTLAPNKPLIVDIQDAESYVTIYFSRGHKNDIVTHYRVNYTGLNGFYEINNISASASSVNLTEGIQSCFNHTIELFAVNSIGQSEPAMAHWVVRSAESPQKPIITSVDQIDGKYVINWKVVSNLSITVNRLSYTSTQGDKGTAWIEGQVNSYVLNFVHRCRQYTLQLVSENKCGYSPASDPYMFDVVPLNPPQVPLDLTANGTDQELTLSWAAPSSSEYIDAYEVDIADKQGVFRYYWAPSNAKSITIRGLNKATTYYASVTGQNACGWSPFAEITVQLNMDGVIVPMDAEPDTR
ncbi:unnamed protein product [Echinostoma caproni]|uniref:Fibronectin type-III domain-containing protein n=1 Tax=Echinostoma caproni TaxID=27848 RepID=A0A183ACZ5_9TREM|nr:unnamed protein product [Echinostoma caproni]